VLLVWATGVERLSIRRKQVFRVDGERFPKASMRVVSRRHREVFDGVRLGLFFVFSLFS